MPKTPHSSWNLSLSRSIKAVQIIAPERGFQLRCRICWCLNLALLCEISAHSRLGGEPFAAKSHRRDAENAELTQRVNQAKKVLRLRRDKLSRLSYKLRLSGIVIIILRGGAPGAEKIET